MTKGILIGAILAVLTVWWGCGVWRHYVKPPKDLTFDWGMTHGNLLWIGTAILVGLWAALGKIVWRTAVMLMER